ncbi:factor associated with metabolism and energy isoform X5 [Peromyscus maniculatus bairdii]|uniref:factor associated with metabolism and energy isoform X5 n=1 Tax=Peromyscus maniculatus bairdii TaxID=230844 RepID=UPI003FD25AC5
MGLGRSKPHPRVIKVTPLQSQEAEIPSAGPVFYALNRNLEEKSSYPFSRLQGQKQALEGLLPPLRETWYGRHPAVSRPMYLDIPLKNEESSIIKRHPPRRIQKLEPIDLPQVITSERLLSQQEARTRHKAKAQMKLHSLQSKARLDMQKLKDHNGNKITESMPRSKHYDVVTILPDETVNRHPDGSAESNIVAKCCGGEVGNLGNPRDEKFVEYHTENDYCVRKIGKMEAWLREQAAQGPLFCDSSSSDSDEPEKDPKRPQALVRTRTERVPLYDEFYDRE